MDVYIIVALETRRSAIRCLRQIGYVPLNCSAKKIRMLKSSLVHSLAASQFGGNVKIGSLWSLAATHASISAGSLSHIGAFFGLKVRKIKFIAPKLVKFA